MLNKMQTAIIKKDIYSITSSKKILTTLIVIPLIMTVVMPSIFIVLILSSPVDSPDLAELMTMLYSSGIVYEESGVHNMLINLILNYIMPLFFLMIPIVASCVMAAGSFVGEKEKNTLETLLYCPLPLKEIFYSKILASFLLSMVVSVFSFIIMIAVTEILIFIMIKSMVLPDINWVFIMLLVSPAVSLVSINLIIRGSAKAQSFEEAQQSSLFLILPVVFLIIGQFTGLMILSPLIVFVIGAVLAVIALVTFVNSSKKFRYENLLR